MFQHWWNFLALCWFGNISWKFYPYQNYALCGFDKFVFICRVLWAKKEIKSVGKNLHRSIMRRTKLNITEKLMKWRWQSFLGPYKILVKDEPHLTLGWSARNTYEKIKEKFLFCRERVELSKFTARLDGKNIFFVPREFWDNLATLNFKSVTSLQTKL